MEKPLYLPLQHTYLEVMGSNPVTSKKCLIKYSIAPHTHAKFPISLPSNTTCLVLPRSFISPLSTYLKQRFFTYTVNVPVAITDWFELFSDQIFDEDIAFSQPGSPNQLDVLFRNRFSCKSKKKLLSKYFAGNLKQQKL